MQQLLKRTARRNNGTLIDSLYANQSSMIVEGASWGSVAGVLLFLFALRTINASNGAYAALAPASLSEHKFVSMRVCVRNSKELADLMHCN